MVKLLRVDRRLIHGQIAFSWTAYLNVDCILVANDDAANDDIRMTTLRLAKPKNTKLIIKSIDDSIAAFRSGKTDKYKIMIVVENVDDAYRLAKEISDIQDINLGNVKAREDSKPYRGDRSVNLTKEDKIKLNELLDLGKNVEIRMVPNDGIKRFKMEV